MRDDATIFVSVASYRDAACPRTLASLFGEAAHPERVTAGVCAQNRAGEDPDCAAPPGRKVVGVSLPAERARGPTYARWLCSRLFRGQDFYLQVDSHTRFAPGWDASLLEQWRSLGDPRAVLTAYPPERMDARLREGRVTVHMCGGEFDADGQVSFAAREVPADAAPQPTPFLAAGFVFMPGAAAAAGLFDRDLPWLFWGEELLLASRLYTRGYNLHSPARAVCSHDYDRGDAAPNVYRDAGSWEGEKRASEARARERLGWGPGGEQAWDGVPGQGTERPVGAYMREAGVDWARRAVHRRCPG